jgi:predicted nucleic acid-binding protein
VILADTSVWVEHFRRHHAGLAGRLERGEIVCHPFVIGEISLGSLRKRDEVLGLMSELPVASLAPHEEVLALVKQRGLAGTGIGWVDAHLIASALEDGVFLWTLDRRLASAARALDLSRAE